MRAEVLVPLIAAILAPLVTYHLAKGAREADHTETYLRRLDHLQLALVSVDDDVGELLAGTSVGTQVAQEDLADAIAAALRHCLLVPAVCRDAGFLDVADAVARRDGSADRDLLELLRRETRQLLDRVETEITRVGSGEEPHEDSGIWKKEAKRLPDERAQAPDPAEAQHLSPVRRKPVSRPARGGRHADDLARERLARGSP